MEAETSGEGMACAKAVGNRGATGGPAGGAGASVRKAGARRGQKKEGVWGRAFPLPPALFPLLFTDTSKPAAFFFCYPFNYFILFFTFHLY